MEKEETKGQHWSVNQSMRIEDEPPIAIESGDQLSLEDLEQAEDDQGIIRLSQRSAIRDETKRSGTKREKSVNSDLNSISSSPSTGE